MLAICTTHWNYCLLIVSCRYLEGNCSEKLISLDGLELDKDLPNYEEILQNNRRKLLSEHFIDGIKRTEVEVQRLYVTVQERAAAEDIKNATKDEILKRIEDKLQQIFDEEVRGPLSSKLEYFKAHPSKAEKEALLVLYNDIIEELQHLEPVDKNCIVEGGEVDWCKYCIIIMKLSKFCWSIEYPYLLHRRDYFW